MTSRRRTWLALPLASVALLSVHACTELGESPVSSITPSNFYKNDQEVAGGLAAVYAMLRNTTWGYYNLSEISTDEMIVPTRGSDWYDNGAWLEIHRQTWAPASPTGLDIINGAWVDAYTGVSRANVLLDALKTTQVANKAAIEAEVRVLRAFYYYMLMDFFGGVPIVTTTEIIPRAQASRAEVFKFIEDELKAATPALPASYPAAAHGRMTKGAADAILASMYLNAEVFTGTVTATGLTKGTNRWADAIAAADRVLNSGQYSLAANYNANFRADNFTSPENILVIKHLNQDGLGLNFVMRALHYHQITSPSPWNGFATLAETYNAFAANDLRRNVFLEGPQNHVETGVPINDRTGVRLVYTPSIPDATQATEGQGVRIYKYPIDPAHVGPENGNDFAYFRLAEMYLIKAEAMNESGLSGGTAGAVALLNTVRARAFATPSPVVGGTQAQVRDLILKERLYELVGEAKRRQDLIRHGKFTQQWSTVMLNGKQQREPYRILFPISQTQMDANPLLKQNPGY